MRFAVYRGLSPCGLYFRADIINSFNFHEFFLGTCGDLCKRGLFLCFVFEFNFSFSFEILSYT